MNAIASLCEASNESTDTWASAVGSSDFLAALADTAGALSFDFAQDEAVAMFEDLVDFETPWAETGWLDGFSRFLEALYQIDDPGEARGRILALTGHLKKDQLVRHPARPPKPADRSKPVSDTLIKSHPKNGPPEQEAAMIT